MMRWLKDKKREKRSNSTSRDDGGKDDDYGFGKEKAVTKSPSSRRELPPTPANPEEKSPHIYEEIPDLPLSCMSDNERILLQSKFSKNKNGYIVAVPESSSVAPKSGCSEKDDISPYMIVAVDNEVRQTPTNFHRNGTPEVHCDVIVKDTHCEILLTRKPKVGAFRLDNPGLSVTGENDGDKRSIRNNTHFCSRDRRASSYVQSAGNLSSAFSVASSGFSSSSASKVHSGGASSSLTLGNLIEPLETCEENDCDKTGEQGVITYSTASNFIPRATKLVFNPLPGKNPCKEAFGSDSSDELHGAGYSSIKDDDFGAAGASFASSREHQSGSKCVTYATVESHDNLEPNTESQVTYASVQDQHFKDSKTKPNYSFEEHHHSPFNLKQAKSLPNSSNDSNNFGGASRTGIIRPLSPSNSSNCIYSLVTFPTEPKHYNTIADINPTDFAEKGPCHEEGFNAESLGVVYSSIDMDDKRNTSEVAFPGKPSFHLSETQRKFSQESTGYNFSEKSHGGFNVDRNRFDSNSGNYRGIADKTELKNGQDTASGVQHGNCAKRSNEFHTSSGHCDNSVQLEFCFCSDEHSSSCGCPETKHNRDDDLASVAGAASDGPNSCTSCGRLIRQITYSESYSDETYDHVYASRLLIRTGRRFSSPDITFSEASNSEFHDIQATHSPDFPYSVSRDDSWMSTRNSDIFPPSYSASAESRVHNTVGHVPQFTEQNFVDEFGCNYDNNRESREQLQRQFIGSKLVEQNNSALSKLGSTLHTFNCPASSRSLAMASVKLPNYPLNNESRVLKNENSSVLDNPRKSLANSSADQGRSLVEPTVEKFVVDKSRKLDSSLTTETKISGFTGLLSKFSRTKSSKSAVPEPAEVANCCAVSGEKSRHGEQLKSDKDLEEIPERNTKKLSKFFQRLASKESAKDTSDSVTPQETDEPASALVVNDVKLAGKPLKLFTLENNTTSTNSPKYCRDEKQSTALHAVKVTDEAQNSKASAEISEKRVISQTHIFPTKAQSCTSGPPISSTALSDQPLAETAIILDNGVASGGECLLTNTKPQFKTDSGDTCYEYDISTSSEGEQTGYEYFLSKVKKTLNLEHEDQHIAESSYVRKKRLCKRCKNEGMYSTIDEHEDDVSDRDWLCPHLAAKFGDMRAIFEDLVVDQRAVILDCLSDYTLSPYGSRGHGHDGYCRECGCEVLTSDSESLTTVCSLLSQQFRMTSPNGQTLSCDSDEGTMADNSCESADENGENNSNTNNKSHYDGNSSGYDEPKGKSESGGLKPRKKERKDKKASSSTWAHFAAKEVEKLSPTSATIQDDSPVDASVLHTFKDGKRATVSSESHRKSILKKNVSTLLSAAHPSRHSVGLYSSLGSDSKDDHSDHSRICDVNRSRASSLTDKVLQDIYAPLPSKALSLLTSRNYGSPVGLTCTCGRGLQASLATMAAHLATGKTIPPPTGCTKKDNSLKPPSTSLPQDGDKKVGVVPVQKHSEKGGKNGSEIEQFILSERKDNPKNDQRTMDCPPENEVLVNNGCSPAQKNAESNECLASQTKPGNRTFRKERPTVPAKEGSPLRNRPAATKQPYKPATKSDCGAFASSHQENDKCAQISLPHTTKDSAGSALNAEITVAGSTEYAYSENPYNDVYERSFVELKTDNSKAECARKHRLKIVALDLLPESAVDEDTTETTQSHKKLAIQPKRSKVIEKMAKLFEGNSDSANNNQKFTKIKEVMISDLATEKNSSHNSLSKKYICEVESQSQTSQPPSENSLISEVSERVINNATTSSKRSFPATIVFNPTRQDNLCGRPENRNLNLNANPPASDLLTTSKTLRSRSGSKQGKVNETKAKSDNESDRLKPEFKSVRVKSGKTKPPYFTESRSVKQRSPTPSSSSASSSSSSKRKSGHAKHKMSKKSYRKRSKHRSERSKNGNGKEERTYYYFSSDFSDIDVVELENCEPYATSASTDTSVSNKLSFSKKKRCVSSDDLLMSSIENSTNAPAQSPNNNIEGADCGFCEQEVYAIPVSSSDLRSRNNSNETGISPQPSPEMTKYRKMKRTDLYKSRKSNNKLLSDLIIRNYDMQVYGNI